MGKRLNILFVSTRWPLPPVTGDRLRCYYVLRELAKHHNVTLISFYSHPRELQMLAGSRVQIRLIPVRYRVVASYFKTLLTLPLRRPLQRGYFNFQRMHRAVQRELAARRYDLVFACMLRAAQFVEDLPDIPKVVDLIDAVSLNYERLLNFPGINRRSLSYLIYSIEKKRVMRYEAELLQRFDRAFLVFDADRRYLGRFADISRVQVVCNGVNTHYFRFNSNSYHPRRIVFHGNIHYPPNADAVLHFYQDIFPHVRSRIPDAQFCVVGNKPRRQVEALTEDPAVLITGRVNDVRTYLWDASVSVSPMRIGAGIQNKILESMATGVPVVTSSLGFEGLEARPGEHLFVSDDPHKFADHIVELMNNPKMRRQVTYQARRWIEEKYTWSHRLKPMLQAIAELA